MDSDYSPPPNVIYGPLRVLPNVVLGGGYAAAGADTAIAGGSDDKALLNATPNDVGPSVPTSFRVGGSMLLDGPIAAETGGSVFQSYAGIATVGKGVPAEYATASAVALGTTNTAVLSYTPVNSGQFVVVLNATHVSAAVAGTFTITYTDAGSGATATQSITIAAGAAGVSSSYFALCNATLGVAIAVTGTSATANDILASCSILAL